MTENAATDSREETSKPSATTGYRADLANAIVLDDIVERRIFHHKNGSRYVNFACIDKITAATWENEMTEYYITRAYNKTNVCCYHPMLNSLYNHMMGSLWVLKINAECGTATPDEYAFWSVASRAINFESLPLQPPLYALLSTIQPHQPKDDRFGRITPKMWTDIINNPFNAANHHMAPGIHKYLNPDFHGILSGCRRVVQGISHNRGHEYFNFFWNLDSTDPRPAQGQNHLAQGDIHAAAGSPRRREFRLIPGYGTYRLDSIPTFNEHMRRTMMDYFEELRLPQPNNAVNYGSFRRMLFMETDFKWLSNLANHMIPACSFYKDRFFFSDLKVTDDSNIGLEMVNPTIPDAKAAFDLEPFPAAQVQQAIQNQAPFVAAAPVNQGDLHDLAVGNNAFANINPNYVWARRIQDELANQLGEHRIYAREKDIPQIHRKNAFIYGVYNPVQTMNEYIGYHETTEGEFFDDDHNPRRYIYNEEDPSRILRQVIKAKLFTRSQDTKSSQYQK